MQLVRAVLAELLAVFSVQSAHIQLCGFSSEPFDVRYRNIVPICTYCIAWALPTHKRCTDEQLQSLLAFPKPEVQASAARSGAARSPLGALSPNQRR